MKMIQKFSMKIKLMFLHIIIKSKKLIKLDIKEQIQLKEKIRKNNQNKKPANFKYLELKKLFQI